MIWVLDTNVVLDWLWFGDQLFTPLARCIDETQRHGAAILATRADCREEIVRVLGYPALRIDTARQHAILASYDIHHSIFPAMLPPGPDTRPALPTCSDPDDQKFLELARDAGATWLITRDAALLSLAPRVRLTQNFDIVDPTTAARRLHA